MPLSRLSQEFLLCRWALQCCYRTSYSGV